MAKAEKGKSESPKKSSFLSSVLSVLNPELRKLAQKLGKSVPEGSILRTDPAERIIGLLVNMLEAKSKQFGPIGGPLVEKFTDLVDYASRDIFGKGKETNGSSGNLDDGLVRFLKEAEKRLAACADAASIALELERLKSELAARKEMIKLAEEAKNELSPSPKKEGVKTQSWDEEYQKIKQKLNEADNKIAPKVRKLNKWLSRQKGAPK